MSGIEWLLLCLTTERGKLEKKKLIRRFILAVLICHHKDEVNSGIIVRYTDTWLAGASMREGGKKEKKEQTKKFTCLT